jgi:uncharacterized RDD family membrane protein YckC
VVTGEAVVLDVRVARLASRVLARFIDLVIQLVLLTLVTLLALLLSETLDTAIIRAIVVVCVGGVVVGYPVVWETLTRGRSPGKMALGLRVVSSDWSPVRFRQSLFRALAEVVEVWMLSGVPAVVVSLLTENAQRLGDIFAGTFVIQERMPRRTAPPAEMPPHLAAWARTLDLSRLPDDTALTARSYLSRRTELDPLAADEMGHRVATAIASYITPPPPPATTTSDYLSAVLAERRTRATPPPPSAPPPAAPAPATEAPPGPPHPTPPPGVPAPQPPPPGTPAGPDHGFRPPS